MDAETSWPEGPWLDAFRAAGHEPELNEHGRPDAFFVDYGRHNGFGCAKCGYRACKHCTAPGKIPPCGREAPLRGPGYEDEG